MNDNDKPDNQPFHVLWAWITRDAKSGKLGPIGVSAPGLGHMPLIGSNKEHIYELRNMAVAHARVLGQPLWFCRFVCSEAVEEIPL